MSIIYDALKRIEAKTKNTKESPGGPKPNNSKFLRRIIYIFCIMIVIGFVGYFMGKPSVSPPPSEPLPTKELNLPVEVETPLPPPSPEEELPPSDKDLPLLSLTGIFFSDGQYSALINDQIVKVGDLIEGTQIQVQKIDSKGVDIKFKDSSFRLNYP